MNALNDAAILVKLDNGEKYVFRKHPIYGIYWETTDTKLNDQEGKLLQFLDSTIGTPLQFLYEAAGKTFYLKTGHNIESFVLI